MSPKNAWREDVGPLILRDICDGGCVKVRDKKGVHSLVVACKESLLGSDLELGRGSRFFLGRYNKYLHIGSTEVEFIQTTCLGEKS